MAHFTIEDPAAFDSTLSKIVENEGKGKQVLVYVFGEKDGSGKSWCPDCVAAEPLLKAGLKHLDASSFIVVECPVKRAEFVLQNFFFFFFFFRFQWLTMAYYFFPSPLLIFVCISFRSVSYRSHPQMQLSAVPTLIWWHPSVRASNKFFLQITKKKEKEKKKNQHFFFTNKQS